MAQKFSLFARFLAFRHELGVLWRAFLAPQTPMHLKAMMLLVPLYLLSPLDLIPDFIPIVGWLDDAVIIPMLVSWIVSLLPQPAPVRPTRRSDWEENGTQIIDGTYRRL